MLPDASPTPRSVVVVGAGLAGARTVGALRDHGFDGPVTLLGDEGVPPYDRPPLSKELFARPEPAWLSGELDTDVTELADARLAARATALDVRDDGVRVSTDDGDVTADAVVLAVGSRAVSPWADALTLHSAADADRLRDRLRPGSRLVVVGAGWVGAEVAGVAAARGVDVTVVEAAAAPLERQLGDVGARTVPWYAEAGVGLRLATPVLDVDAGGVRTATGRLGADVVLAAVGARPATAWLEASWPDLALTADGRVPVDGAGRWRSDAAPELRQRVWAVGDCAARPHPVFGTVPGGHWSSALTDPDATVRELLALPAVPHPPAPYVFSQQLGHDLAFFGVRHGDEDVVVRPLGAGWAALYLAPGAGPRRVLRAAVVADSPRDVGGLRRLLGGAGAVEVDLDRAADPAVRWRDLPL
ncbi:NADPH-dependent 2,4-dienoyl-CoA reductase/sulfur reductase-like enzyme [Isoptericola sp. CG 20/1183]|uniref:NADPH-dependent 2,4-dienoyl-CoA reductase/sulfur reductase-like enzyme n=1 Tax=Isoptericola halotolerans TaxID=300560 RepID=A0ABX5EGM4_9MICO|nr:MULTISPECIES: FAD-dependent oxidoreductase [Isoptericola]MCK0118064.1 FAD-dependent oxidoreductase [Isoptericola sp. S6320L]PRZ06942.1 NADPH-dependent 2,4-dienoyl-CoA reductase/sulfur reductase-like enzyme [Isoptericola halotolerans]PRZ07386.1 NADPH-dependent 2,4-dienoyl-CoA reductase/sulfur reductase-like enzyme [Isoptericola sp. CG 20/1183]